jgi:hypothetical protein
MELPPGADRRSPLTAQGRLPGPTPPGNVGRDLGRELTARIAPRIWASLPAAFRSTVSSEVARVKKDRLTEFSQLHTSQQSDQLT